MDMESRLEPRNTGQKLETVSAQRISNIFKFPEPWDSTATPVHHAPTGAARDSAGAKCRVGHCNLLFFSFDK